MRTIIAGSRTITDSSKLIEAIEQSHFEITKVLCGGAHGVDRLGELYALDHDIPIQYFLANWEEYGKAAGPIRNTEMAENADALILIWDGASRGSADMLKKATAKGLKVFVHIVQLRDEDEC